MQTSIVTVCIGDSYNKLSKLTHPTLKAYADKIGADFNIVSDRNFPYAHPSWERLRLNSYLEKYDRIIYLDTDILVQKNCPNLFDYIPEGYFGAFQEGKYIDRHNALIRGSFQFYISAPKNWLYFNAGVMVLDKSHKPIFDDRPGIFHNNFYEQTWLNLQVGKYCPDKVIDIGPYYNRMPSMDWDKRFESHIIHYAGGATYLIKDDLNKI